MLFHYRTVAQSDHVHILDCDIKCFDWAWSVEEWAYQSEAGLITIAAYYGAPIAFATYHYEPESNTVFVPKVGVKLPYRNRGVGRRLIEEVHAFASRTQAAAITSLVPESSLRPGEPRDISGWLRKMGFHAVGITRGCFPALGDMEDGVRFIKALKDN